MFIALTGLPSEKLAAANEALTRELSLSPVFRKVVNQAGELGQEGLAFVEENRYQLSHHNLSERFSLQGLKDALQERVRGLTSPQASLEKQYLRKDPTAEVLTLLEDWQGKLSKHKRPEELHGLCFPATIKER